MQLFKFLPIVAFWSTIVVAHQAGASGPLVSSAHKIERPGISESEIESALKPKSFREWKNERIQASKSRVDSLKSKVESLKSAAKTEAGLGKELQIDKLVSQLDQAQFSLDLAQELSVTDYFVGYLTKMDDRKAAISSVAGKLTPEEVAELMNAYANSFFGSQGGAAAGSEAKVGDLTK